MEFDIVIGLEIHAQLATKSKMFSAGSTKFGSNPNSQACAVDLAMPGVLPVLNKNAVKMAIKFGIAIDAEINNNNIFARKNYFYPDLPKGYQISQFEIPIVGKGHIDITTADGKKTIGITRAHLEEDAGKSIHDIYEEYSAIDLNRAGVPLLEIVSEPDMSSAKEAVQYARKIHSLVQYLEICDGNMQEGSFRCDANVSLKPKGQQELGTRAEIKNINSFKFLEKAIDYEVDRQADILLSGEKVVQETRLYNAERDETRAMRTKEEANDYRYFPDPDLLPVKISKVMFKKIKHSMPELPEAKKQRFIDDYNLSEYDADILISQKELAKYFEVVVSMVKTDAKLCANWIMVELLAMLNKNNLTIDESPVTARDLAQLILRIKDNTISGKIAKEVFASMWAKDGNVDEIIEKKGLKQITDVSEIEEIVDKVIAQNQSQVEQYKNGNERIFGFFVGQVMKQTAGKANPQQVNNILKQKLS